MPDKRSLEEELKRLGEKTVVAEIEEGCKKIISDIFEEGLEEFDENPERWSSFKVEYSNNAQEIWKNAKKHLERVDYTVSDVMHFSRNLMLIQDWSIAQLEERIEGNAPAQQKKEKIIDATNDVMSHVLGLYLSSLINKISEEDTTFHFKDLKVKEMDEDSSFFSRSKTDYIYLNYVGYEFSKGEIVIEGNVKNYLGKDMKGGGITVKGSSRYNTGENMSGGSIKINKGAGTGAGSSMKSGLLVIGENCGDNLGSDMSGGEIIVNKNSGNHTASGMKGGKVTVKGNTGFRAGENMESGFLLIEGNTSRRLGYRGKGGKIHVKGSAGGQAGCESRSDIIIEGDVDIFAGYKLPEGGSLLIKGNSGDSFADTLKGGVAVCEGSAGDFAAKNMLSGTATVSKAGDYAGRNMKGGKLHIVYAGENLGEDLIGGEIEISNDYRSLGKARFGKITKKGQVVFQRDNESKNVEEIVSEMLKGFKFPKKDNLKTHTLLELCNIWLNKLPKNIEDKYNYASEFVSRLDYSSKNIEELIPKLKYLASDSDFREVGIYLSALINKKGVESKRFDRRLLLL